MITGLWTQCIPRGTQTQDHDLGSRPVSNLAASGITAPPERCGHSATFPGPSPPPQDTCAGHSQKEICVPSTLGACTTGFCSQPLSLGTPRLWETPLPRTPSSITATHSLAACQSRPWGGGASPAQVHCSKILPPSQGGGTALQPRCSSCFPSQLCALTQEGSVVCVCLFLNLLSVWLWHHVVKSRFKIL